jgi:hypothetical protein
MKKCIAFVRGKCLKFKIGTHYVNCDCEGDKDRCGIQGMEKED